jgi:hypothetical protein
MSKTGRPHAIPSVLGELEHILCCVSDVTGWFLGTMFTIALCCFEPGPQDTYRGIILKRPHRAHSLLCFKCHWKVPETRLTIATSCFKPGPQEPYRDILEHILCCDFVCIFSVFLCVDCVKFRHNIGSNSSNNLSISCSSVRYC